LWGGRPGSLGGESNRRRIVICLTSGGGFRRIVFSIVGGGAKVWTVGGRGFIGGVAERLVGSWQTLMRLEGRDGAGSWREGRSWRYSLINIVRGGLISVRLTGRGLIHH